MNGNEQPEDLEAGAAMAIGRIVLVFSRLEFNVGLWLRRAVGRGDLEMANPLIERLSFKGKLDALLDIARRKHQSDSAAIKQLTDWLKEVDRLRATRNSFMHGRWGFEPAAGEVINVAPGLPGRAPLRETRYSIAQLKNQHAKALALSDEFSAWVKQWPV